MEANSASESIYNIINDLFSKLFSSVDNSIYGILDKITFLNKDILENSNFQKILGESNSSGILLVCNALVFRFRDIFFYKLFNFSSYSWKITKSITIFL